MQVQSGKEKYDVVQSWLDTVAYSHSNSSNTEQLYRRALTNFLEFIEQTPQKVLTNYEKMSDREFRRLYAQYLKSWLSSLRRNDYADITVTVMVSAVKSFFKYSDLPLGYVPVGSMRVKFHNRDITKEEIAKIFEVSRPRERAFYCMMAQTGLRPDTLCHLKMKHIEPDFSKGVLPCKVDIPQEIAKGKYRSYFSFMAEESVKHLKAYLATKPKLQLEDYLFTKQGYPNKMANPKSMSKHFAGTIEKLKQKGLMDFKQEQKGKPRSVRLYSLRKFFRKYAHQAGFEFVQFWMGHLVSEGQEEHYRPRDIEFHRRLYSEKSMPFLRIATATPSETAKLIEELREQLAERNEELNVLRETAEKLQPLLSFINGFESEEKLQRFLDLLKSSSVISFPEADTVLHRMEVSDEEKEWLTRTAEELGISEDDVIKGAMSFYLKHLKKKQNTSEEKSSKKKPED